jgi:hypothetical protein
VAANLLSETLISFSEAARLIPAYRGQGRCNPSTIFRWATIGITAPSGERVFLEVIRLGGRYLTTREALERWAHRLTPTRDDAEPTRPTPRTPGRRQRESERAAKQLEKAGI